MRNYRLVIFYFSSNCNVNFLVKTFSFSIGNSTVQHFRRLTKYYTGDIIYLTRFTNNAIHL